MVFLVKEIGTPFIYAAKLSLLFETLNFEKEAKANMKLIPSPRVVRAFKLELAREDMRPLEINGVLVEQYHYILVPF